jgi:hypothetical protein
MNDLPGATLNDQPISNPDGGIRVSGSRAPGKNLVTAYGSPCRQCVNPEPGCARCWWQRGVNSACAEAVATPTGACVAVFDVPGDAHDARLTLPAFYRPLPGATPATGVAHLRF